VAELLKAEINASGFRHHSMFGDFKADFERLNADFVIHTEVAS